MTILLPTFVSYALSFIYLAIYWNNHHHMLHAVKKVNGPILWANTHLLFWLSLVPFATAWMGEEPLRGPARGALRRRADHGGPGLLPAEPMPHPLPQRGLGARFCGGQRLQGQVSIAIYAIAILLSFVNRWIGFGLYWVVALIWLVPDRRIERAITE